MNAPDAFAIRSLMAHGRVLRLMQLGIICPIRCIPNPRDPPLQGFAREHRHDILFLAPYRSSAFVSRGFHPRMLNKPC